MVTPCGGGAATFKPEVGQVTVITAASVESALIIAGAPEVAAMLAPILAGKTYQLTQFCTEDPPTQPTITPFDIVSALNPSDPVHWQPAVDKLGQWFDNWYWYQACQCTDTTTPPAPPLVAPTGVSVNGGLPSGATKNCWSLQTNFQAQPKASGPQFIELTKLLLPQGADSIQVTTNDDLGPYTHTATRILPNISAFQWITQNVGPADPPGYSDTSAPLILWTSAGVEIKRQTLLDGHAPQTGPINPNFSVPTNAAYVSTYLQMATDTLAPQPLYNWNINIAAICPGDGVSSPCCPPDPLLDIRLEQILQLVTTILQSQGAGPADTLTRGAVHSNLSGNGSILLQVECAAVDVHVHQPIPALGVNPGTPDYYFSMGFITSYAVGSPLKGWRLVYTDQIFPIATYADQIGFTLPPGIVIDITEMTAAAAVG